MAEKDTNHVLLKPLVRPVTIRHLLSHTSGLTYGTDLSVNPATGMIAIFMTQCTSGDQWSARDLFLKTATEVFQKAKQN